MLHMPTPMLMSGVGGKSYADWVAHIAVTYPNSAAWSAELATIGMSSFRTTAGADTGGLQGSPWMTLFRRSSGTGSSVVCRMVQHALPSAAVYLEQQTAGRQIVFRQGYQSEVASFLSVNRNGFASSAVAEPGSGYFCDFAAWWDDATQTALMNNPQAGTGPVPYTASGW